MGPFCYCDLVVQTLARNATFGTITITVEPALFELPDAVLRQDEQTESPKCIVAFCEAFRGF